MTTMLDWNGNGERDSFDLAMDLMVLDEFEREEHEEQLELELIGTGYDRDDLAWLDEDVRDDILFDTGLDPDDYDFD